MKITRNSPCPCGSGKKYKQCCIGKQVGAVGEKTVQVVKSVDEIDRLESLSIFAALQAFPENGNHLVGLQERIFNLLKVGSMGKSLTNAQLLTSIFWENHLKGARLNKPDVFSTNITSILGNVTVLPGLLKGGGLLLQAMLNILFLDQRNNFALDFHRKAYAATFFILKVAGHLSDENGIQPFDETYIELNSVFVPDKTVLDAYSGSCLLNRTAIEKSLKSRNLPLEVINDFIIDPEGLPEDFEEDNPFLFRPLMDLGGALLVLCPVNLVSALYFFLWKLAVDQGCSDEVSKLYNAELQLMVKRSVFHMGWKWVRKSSFDSTYEHIMAFHMDTDKLAILIYYPDVVSPENYYKNNPILRNDDPPIGPDLMKQMDKMNALLDQSELHAHKRLFIAIIGNTGREAKALVDIPEYPFLMFNYQDWVALCHGGENYRALTLWYFFFARERFLQDYDTLGASVLDLFALYLAHEESFYLSNEAFEQYPIDPAVTDAFVKAAEKKAATKVLSYQEVGSTQINFIPVLLLDEYDEVYVSDPATGMDHHLAITGFPQTIWFKPQDEEGYWQYDTTGKGFFQELIKMAAYWLNQAKADIKPILSALELELIDVRISISDPDRFFNPITESKVFPEGHQPVYVSLTSSGILLDYNSAFAELLDWADNRGERYFLLQLLEVFNQVAIRYGLTDRLDIKEVTDRIAPLGRKKKLTILNAVTDVRLLGDHLGKAKYLSSYYTNRVLDELTTGLDEDFVSSLPQLTDKKEKLKFLFDLVFKTLIPKLRQALN